MVSIASTIAFIPLILQMLVACFFFHSLNWPWWIPIAAIAALFLIAQRFKVTGGLEWLLWLAAVGALGWLIVERV